MTPNKMARISTISIINIVVSLFANVSMTYGLTQLVDGTISKCEFLTAITPNEKSKEQVGTVCMRVDSDDNFFISYDVKDGWYIEEVMFSATNTITNVTGKFDLPFEGPTSLTFDVSLEHDLGFDPSNENGIPYIIANGAKVLNIDNGTPTQLDARTEPIIMTIVCDKSSRAIRKRRE